MFVYWSVGCEQSLHRCAGRAALVLPSALLNQKLSRPMCADNGPRLRLRPTLKSSVGLHPVASDRAHKNVRLERFPPSPRERHCEIPCGKDCPVRPTQARRQTPSPSALDQHTARIVRHNPAAPQGGTTPSWQNQRFRHRPPRPSSEAQIDRYSRSHTLLRDLQVAIGRDTRRVAVSDMQPATIGYAPAPQPSHLQVPPAAAA